MTIEDLKTIIADQQITIFSLNQQLKAAQNTISNLTKTEEKDASPTSSE